ncbi:MAG: 1-deoxy-D-xylulose-5-phosphate reductoisomerase [Atopobiaceae bacterium]|nr:1-deoxy-D-xylulose-5-phosphate reductoisomerase [Atopobiaceae bacterium]MBQ6411465.1 1-deoxy-D-xylulose-5-phosphate reductoisomerase [Atopobiaceae bacterium]
MSIADVVTRDVERHYPLRLAILGCSGSVGRQTLDVCRKHPDKLQVTALSVHSSTDFLVAAAREFNVRHVSVASEDHVDDPILQELPRGCELTHGKTSVSGLALLDDVDCVVVCVVGMSGIWVSYQGIVNDKIVACANKESLVAGGDLLMPLVRRGNFVPIDSEHSAIFQCLLGEPLDSLRRIWLTCSGGPFFGMTRAELERVTVEQALAHPNWRMGPKITVDCASLMNKGLEVLEAHQLFSTPLDDITVVVHRQSKIHSMVEFKDGSVKAQVGPSDMRIPIQYALSYPDRWDAPSEPLDFLSEGPLSFAAPDFDTFRCLGLAYEAGRIGGTMPCVLNAANEVANKAFRDGRCSLAAIDEVVGAVMNEMVAEPVESLAQLTDVDRRSRALAREFLETIGQR